VGTFAKLRAWVLEHPNCVFALHLVSFMLGLANLLWLVVVEALAVCA